MNYYNGNRPKTKPHTLTIRHSDMVKTILDFAMEEYNLNKSELLNRIIIEWNMLRYKENN